MNNQWFSKVAVWLVIALVLFTVFKQLDRSAVRADAIGYSEFLAEVNAGRIAQVTIQEGPGNIEIVAASEVGDNLGHFVGGLDNLVYFNEDEICGEVLESFNLQVSSEAGQVILPSLAPDLGLCLSPISSA